MKTIFYIILISVSMTLTVQAQVYRWVDADGKVHYGNNAPQNKAARQVDTTDTLDNHEDPAWQRQQLAAQEKAFERRQLQRQQQQLWEQKQAEQLNLGRAQQTPANIDGVDEAYCRRFADARCNPDKITGVINDGVPWQGRRFYRPIPSRPSLHQPYPSPSIPIPPQRVPERPAALQPALPGVP